VSTSLPRCGLRAWCSWLVLRRRVRLQVEGRSMLPGLAPGDYVLSDPRAYRSHPPRVGDVVVARHPLKPGVRVIKRVAAIAADGRLTLRGDNPGESTDSRAFGALSPDAILGKVTCRLG
jgi:nickel-type superoxide dismutase maturation protease